MHKKPKILFLSSRLPYPPVGGDKLKNYYLLQILAKHADVHLVTVTDETLDEKTLQFIRGCTKTCKIFSKPGHTFRLNALKSIYNGLPLQVNYYHFDDVRQYVEKKARDADLIFCTLIRTAKYAEHIAKPKILDMADSIALNYLNSYQREKSFLWKTLYRFESQRLLESEKKAIDTFDKTLFFNRWEMDFFNKPGRTVWIPHGVNEELLEFEQYNPAYSNCVVFFGKMDYPPNVNAVLWFCENVLHRLKPGLRFIVVGAKPGRAVRQLPSKYGNVQVTGFVECPYEILKSSLCVIAPMQTGGGIQNKILEAMALGTVVVTTPLAAKPIVGARHKRALIVEDHPHNMADLINNIFSNPDLYVPVKQNARRHIRNNFTWTIYESKILDVIDSVLERPVETTSPALVT